MVYIPDDCPHLFLPRDLLQHGPVARLHDSGMLDICGWDPDYVRIVQAFLAHRWVPQGWCHWNLLGHLHRLLSIFLLADVQFL